MDCHQCHLGFVIHSSNHPIFTILYTFLLQNGDGKIDIAELRECCIQFNLPIDPELQVQLIDYCDTDGDGAIDHVEFANFLNWKDKMTSQGSGPVATNKEQPAEEPVKSAGSENIKKQIDAAIGEHRTSASMINAVVGGISTRGWCNIIRNIIMKWTCEGIILQ